MKDQTLSDAKTFLAQTATDDVAAFEEKIAEKGAEVLHRANGIDWWNATGNQRKTLIAAVKTGTKQADCQKSLEDYCSLINASADFPKNYVTDEFNRSGWFDYFYNEAVGARNLGADDQELLQTITSVFFMKRKKSAPSGTVSLVLPYDSVDETVFKDVLTALLSMGFERIPSTKQQAVAGDASDAAIIGRLLWAGDAAAVQGTQVKVIPVEFKWRADSRPYNDIKLANGFSTKANSDGYARNTGLRAGWHPYSDDSIRNYLWFRKSNTDNCLYNVVSVGKSASKWQTYLPYPLIKLSGGKVAKVRGYQGTRSVRSVPATGGAEVNLELPVTETYLYLFVFAGLALDTGAMQGKQAYPEVGVGSIPFKNVYGAIKCVRFHLGDADSVTDDDGLLAALSTSVVTDDDNLSIRASYGQELFDKMKLAFDSAAKSPVVGVKWMSSGDGYAEFHPTQKEFSYKGARYKVAQVPSV